MIFMFSSVFAVQSFFKRAQIENVSINSLAGLTKHLKEKFKDSTTQDD